MSIVVATVLLLKVCLVNFSAAMTTEKMASLVDMVQCTICLETFTNPKMLPCIHTFGLECLRKFCKDNDSGEDVACPLYRKLFTVPLKGIQGLPNNFFMNQLMQVNQSQGTTSEALDNNTQCELCLDHEVQSTAFCIECDQYICDQHLMIHNRKQRFRSHQVVNTAERPSKEMRVKMAISYCEQHPDKPIELYCYDCKDVTCLMCYVKKHSKHECSDVNESADKFLPQLTVDIEKVGTCANQSRKEVERIEANIKMFCEKIACTENAISHQSNQLIALIQSHERQLIEEINFFKDKQLKEMESSKNEAERQFVITDGFKRYCQELKDKGNACDISRAANDLHDRTKELFRIQEGFKSYELSGTVNMFTPTVVTIDQIRNLFGDLYTEPMAFEG